MRRKSYSELVSLPAFEERFEYLRLNGNVGAETFGYDRFLSQAFYSSPAWRRARRQAIIRDESCDLAVPDRPIFSRPVIHHINPIGLDELEGGSRSLLDPENLITVSRETHNAIHYGDATLIAPSAPVERTRGDTCPWKKQERAAMQEDHPKPSHYHIFGKVTADRLPVYESAYGGGNVVCTLSRGDTVMIDLGASDERLYAVCTAFGIEGYADEKLISM